MHPFFRQKELIMYQICILMMDIFFHGPLLVSMPVVYTGVIRETREVLVCMCGGKWSS